MGWIAPTIFCGLLSIVGIIVWTQFPLLDPADRARFLGAVVGAALTASIAVLVFWLARFEDSRKKAASVDKLRIAIWQDIWVTLPCIVDELEHWASHSGLSISETRSLQAIYPVVCEQALTQMHDLKIDEQHFLLLLNDNLRLARERIGVVLDTRTVSPSDCEEIADILLTACKDGAAALNLFDNGGSLTAQLTKALKENPRWRGAEWRERLGRAIGAKDLLTYSQNLRAERAKLHQTPA